MTQSPPAGIDQEQEQEWREDVIRAQQEQLRAMSDHDLDTLVAATFDDPNPAVAFSTSWDGLGRIVERLRECDYTVHLISFDSSFESHEPPCVFIARHRTNERRRLPPTWPDMRAAADTFPRAAAIANVLIHQMQQVQKDLHRSTHPQPEQDCSERGWTDERRRRHSEQMKAYWEQRRGGRNEAEQDEHG